MRRIALFSLFLAIAACEPPAKEAPEALASTAQAITAGTIATGYPEACQIELTDATGGAWACSGSIIAPKLLLTAAHCVESGRWVTAVKCPLHPDPILAARNIAVTKTVMIHPNYVPSISGFGLGPINISYYDIAVVPLAEAVPLPAYPTLATQVPANGTQVVRIGRMLNTAFTNTMYQKVGTVSTSLDSPYPTVLLISPDVAIEPGDSGGPDILYNVTPHQIVGVNSIYVPIPPALCGICPQSAADGLSRVDLAAPWISQQIGSLGGCPVAPCGTGFTCDVATATCIAGCGTKPCLAGYRCDTTSQLCVAGCSVTGCTSTQRCDTTSQLCVNGCSITGCGTNQKCDSTSQLCVPGCGATGCAAGQRCDTTSQLCVPGCAVTGCTTNRRCDTTTQACVDGCVITGCVTGKACDTTTQLCVASTTGCAAACDVGQRCDATSHTCVDTCMRTGCPSGSSCDAATLTCKADPPKADGGSGEAKSGGCGCSAGAEGSLPALLGLALWVLAFPLRRRFHARG